MCTLVLTLDPLDIYYYTEGSAQSCAHRGRVLILSCQVILSDTHTSVVFLRVRVCVCHLYDLDIHSHGAEGFFHVL